MADLSITAANVKKDVSAKSTEEGVAGEAITAGQPVYKDSSASDKLKKSRANAAGTSLFSGIALNDAALDQPVVFLKSGKIDLGATLVLGEAYVVSSAVAGAIAPIGDLGIGDYAIVLGVALAANQLELSPQVSPTAKA